jgi:3-keto-L-gulonate-6-phosphate decarboxylase
MDPGPQTAHGRTRAPHQDDVRRLHEQRPQVLVAALGDLAPDRAVAKIDDQKRTVDVEEAFENGADYVVVGRPIKNATDRAAAARNIQDRIARLFLQTAKLICSRSSRLETL